MGYDEERGNKVNHLANKYSKRQSMIIIHVSKEKTEYCSTSRTKLITCRSSETQ